jgi:NAD(P)H-flavin reductase
MHVFWGASSEQDFYLRDFLSEWQARFPEFQVTLMTGRTADQHRLLQAVLTAYPDLSDYQIYASGGEALVFSALDAFLQHGLDRKHFYSDVFDYDETA